MGRGVRLRVRDWPPALLPGRLAVLPEPALHGRPAGLPQVAQGQDHAAHAAPVRGPVRQVRGSH